MNSFKKYFAKVLLFGEYTVLYGGNALAAPLKNLYATWERVDSPESTFTSLIKDWCTYIDERKLPLNTKLILDDWDKGYRFVTDVPTGYGIGSSGILTAIFYDLYRTEETPNDIRLVKETLGKIESFFHGQSSGLDPLISYKNSMYMINNDHVEHISKIDLQDFNVYLLDSGVNRSTVQWVNAFKNKSKSDLQFHSGVTSTLTDLVHKAINICKGEVSGDLEIAIKQISYYQREAWSWMIPVSTLSKWDNITATGNSYVKFCGAGGGGYFLVFSRDNIEGKFDFLKKVDLCY